MLEMIDRLAVGPGMLTIISLVASYYNHINLRKWIHEQAESRAGCWRMEGALSGFGSLSPEWWSGDPGQSWSGEWEF